MQEPIPVLILDYHSQFVLSEELNLVISALYHCTTFLLINTFGFLLYLQSGLHSQIEYRIWICYPDGKCRFQCLKNDFIHIFYFIAQNVSPVERLCVISNLNHYPWYRVTKKVWAEIMYKLLNSIIVSCSIVISKA